ncbi:ABC transporter periplasmic protein [Salinisphaera hydrothermalis C41B8]|uniref:ABC transporter periplasmic protein n=2 Tax=Salinisphaera TaxID=180541 RepID=A0A084II11_SALHC|nr:ABC transporter periplasmic protein [Salinisphaera hydrothermalis C41B8]
MTMPSINLRSVRRGLALALLPIAAVALPAAAASDHKKPNDQLVIGMSFQELNNPYFVTMQKALQKQVDKMGAKLIVTDAHHDISKQTSDVEDMIQRGVDILLLNPTDTVGVQSAVVSAHNAGIPVVAVDAQADGPVSGFVGSKNFKAGYLACQYLAKSLDGKGKVAILNGIPVTPILQRVKGCKKALGEAKGIQIVDEQNGHQERDTAMNVTENMLQSHPDLDGLFSVNDGGTLGALVALNSSDNHVKLATIDGNPEVIKAMQKANTPIVVDVAQHPDVEVVKALHLALKKYRGEKSPDTIPVDVTPVTPKTAASFHWGS